MAATWRARCGTSPPYNSRYTDERIRVSRRHKKDEILLTVHEAIKGLLPLVIVSVDTAGIPIPGGNACHIIGVGCRDRISVALGGRGNENLMGGY